MSNKVTELLVKLVNEHGVYKAMQMTGLDIIQLFDRLGNNVVIDSEMANELLRMLWNQNLLPKNVNNWKWYSLLGAKIRYRRNNSNVYSILGRL